MDSIMNILTLVCTNIFVIFWNVLSTCFIKEELERFNTHPTPLVGKVPPNDGVNTRHKAP